MRNTPSALLLLAMLVLGAGYAAAQPAPKPTIDHAWARATVAAVKTGAAYLTITAHGAPDKLVSASTPVAERAELHETQRDGDIMKMRPVESLDIAGTAKVVLAPSGLHLMLIGLKQPLVPGQHFPLSLTFQNAGTVETEIVVERAGAAGPMDMDHGMPGMMPATKP